MENKMHRYNPGDKVFAVSRWYDNGKPTDHVAIYPAIVEQVTIYKDGHEYWLQTVDGQSWGCETQSNDVFDSFEEACKYMKEVWMKEGNIKLL